MVRGEHLKTETKMTMSQGVSVVPWRVSRKTQISVWPPSSQVPCVKRDKEPDVAKPMKWESRREMWQRLGRLVSVGTEKGTV